MKKILCNKLNIYKDIIVNLCSSIVIFYFFSRDFNELYFGSTLKVLAYIVIILFSLFSIYQILMRTSLKNYKVKSVFFFIIVYVAYIIINGLVFKNIDRFYLGVKYYLFYPTFLFFWLFYLKYINLKFFKIVFYIVSFVTFFIAIYENITGNFIIPITIDPNNMTVVGTMVGDDFMYRSLGLVGSYLSNGTICAVFSLIYFWKTLYKKIYYASPFIIGVLAVFATGSRGPLVALCISVLSVLIIYVNENKLIKKMTIFQKKAIFLLIIILVCLFAGLIISDFSFGINFLDIKIERIRQIFDWTNNPANSTRLNVWKESLELFMSSPILGIGIGSTGANGFGTITIGVTESGILKVLVETGIIGLVLYFGPLLLFLFGITKNYLSNRSKYYSLFISEIILILTENCILQILSDPIIYLLFTLFIAYLIYLFKDKEEVQL